MFYMLIFFTFSNDFFLTPCDKIKTQALYIDTEKSFDTKKLDLLLDYCNVHPRKIFKLCRKNKKDCSYYKARLFEYFGNTKDAMDLYLRSSKYERYLYLLSSNAENPEALFEKYKIKTSAKIFYLANYYFSKGSWSEVIKNTDSIKNINEQYKAKLIFLIAYSYVMLGDIKTASEYLSYKFENFYYNLEIKKIDAIILYSKNEQANALNIIKKILKYYPNDSLILKYYAEINFRLGFFKEANKSIDNLIKKETRDTEKFYFLQEKAFMLLRYGFIKQSLLLFDSILVEYPKNIDLIYEYIVLLINYSFVNEAEVYIKKLNNIDAYFYNLALSLKEDYFYNIEASIKYLETANKIKESKSLLDKIKTYKNIIDFKGKDKKISCSNYSITKLNDGILQIIKDETKYFIKKQDDLYNVFILINFNFREGINVKIYDLNNFIKDIEDFWSTDLLKLNIIQSLGNTVTFDYFPSSLYIKRADSLSWPILLNNKTYFHEIGHLLGLDDEYYETDHRLKTLNKKRVIGSKNSLMRNILSGIIEKKHIELILYPALYCEASNAN